MARNSHPEETVELILNTATQLFVEKGYDNTSIQDIIDNLGGLSKGAIYHHFKSKKEIFDAVMDMIGKQNEIYYSKVCNTEGKTGLEKLKDLLRSACVNPANEATAAISRTILSDSKFVVAMITEIYREVVPRYVQPIIEEGMRDGSINVKYPKELSAAIMTLLNIWINPMLNVTAADEIHDRVCFLRETMKLWGLDIINDEMAGYFERYLKLYEKIT